MSSLTIEDPAFARRSDLDALRAVAMLLGIVLHASHVVLPVVLDRHGSSAEFRFRDRLLRHPRLPDAALLRHERLLQRDAAAPARPHGRWSSTGSSGCSSPCCWGWLPSSRPRSWISTVAMSSASGKPGGVVADRGGVGHLGGRGRGRPRRHRAAPGEWGGGQRPGRQIRRNSVAAGGGRRVARRPSSCSSGAART